MLKSQNQNQLGECVQLVKLAIDRGQKKEEWQLFEVNVNLL